MMVRRLLCETVDNVMLLLGEALADPGDDFHERYLAAFCSEEVDGQGNLSELPGRAQSRRKVRSFLDCMEERTTGEVVPQGDGLENATGAMYRLDSGDIHGNASGIMRLYDGKSGKFRTDGAIDDERVASELQALWQTTFAVMQCVASVRARAFGWKSWLDATQMAKNFAANAWLVREMAGLRREPTRLLEFLAFRSVVGRRPG